MLHKTRGIIISYLRYRETSIIVKIYTEAFGLQTYIENGVRSSKGRNRIALFQPLTLLDLVVYYKESGAIARISEIRCHTPYTSLPYGFRKAAIGMFLTEVLAKTLKEEMSNPELFEFLFASLSWLDAAPTDYENFHLQFLLKLAKFIGFAPGTAEELLEQTAEMRLRYGESEEKTALQELMTQPYGNGIKISSSTRRTLLLLLLRFYALHVDNFGEVRSLPILQEVME